MPSILRRLVLHIGDTPADSGRLRSWRHKWSIEDLIVFTRVVETKSFTAAARELHKSPAAVSRHISRLEEELSVKLLNRSTHHLALTQTGAVFYEHCTRIVAELEEARAEAAGLGSEVKGVLRVHCSPGIADSLVSDVVMDFLESNNAVSVELTVGEITANVMKHGVDVMISSRYSGHDQKLHSSLFERDLGPTPYVVCASENYFAKHGQPSTPHDLQKHNCVLHITQKIDAAEWQFATDGADYTVLVSGTFRSNFEAAVLRAALRGIGIARLPKYKVARYLAAGTIRSIFDGQVQSGRVIKVYYPRSKYVPVLTRAFLECLERNYKQMHR